MKKYAKIWTKSRAIAGIALSLLGSVSAFSPNTAYADAKEIRGRAAECNMLEGSWKRVGSGIYSCRYGYRNYNVYNFKVGSVNICRDGKCKTTFPNKDKGSGRKEK